MTLEEQIEELRLFVKEMVMAGANYEIGMIDDPGPGVMVTDPLEPARTVYEILYFHYDWDKSTWCVYNDVFSFALKAPKKERRGSAEVPFDVGLRILKDKVNYG